MNRTLKVILIIINIIMLVIAIKWYLEKNELEPLIVSLGQLATLLGLVFEGRVSKIITKGVKNNSDVDIDVQSGDNVDTSDIDNSKVQIKTK